MSEAEVAQLEPYAIEVEAGKTYWWCACGRSQTQPFCDGSHEGTDLGPIEFAANRTETVYLCGCKATRNQPYCDGSHNDLIEDI